MTFHDLKASQIDGQPLDFSSLRGKKVIVVNTASECGYTPQYAQLEELYHDVGANNLEILGFPSNDFGAQEPGSASVIAQFCSVNFGITFRLMEKVGITNQPHPVYQWLTDKAKNGVGDFPVTWNFQKFLIDENGNLVDSVDPEKSPFDKQILEWLRNKRS